MSKKLFDELNAEVRRRSDDQWRQQADLMANLWEGKLPAEYEKYFPKNAPKHHVQVVNLAWSDIATQVGRLPDLVSEALNESAAEEARVGLHERIGHSYLRNSEPTGKLLMWQLAWWLVGTGRAVAYVKPDPVNMRPVMTVRDPRDCYPNMRVVGSVPVEIYDVLFRYEVPKREAVSMGLAPAETDRYGAGPYEGDSKKCTIIEFIDDYQHVIISEYGIMQRAEHGLGAVPAWVFQSFAPNSHSGLGLFNEQVSLMVAISMMISLKLAAADKTVNPIYWAKGHVGTIKIGASVLNKLSSTGEIGILSPPQLAQADSDIDMLMQLSRILNRNTEVRQGEVQGKGQYTSAKTLEQLSEAIDTTVGQYWDIMSVGLQHMFEASYRMDEIMWPDEKKTITTTVRGDSKRLTYTPSKDIKGRYYINVNYGFGLDGYQGFLQSLQANQAGMMSRKRVIESMPGVSDVQKELVQMDLEDMDNIGKGILGAQAAAGALDINTWASLRKEMEGGKPLHEMVIEQQEQLQEQAANAAQSPGNTEGLTAPPAETVRREIQARPPGLNPAALV